MKIENNRIVIEGEFNIIQSTHKDNSLVQSYLEKGNKSTSVGTVLLYYILTTLMLHGLIASASILGLLSHVSGDASVPYALSIDLICGLFLPHYIEYLNI